MSQQECGGRSRERDRVQPVECGLVIDGADRGFRVGVYPELVRLLSYVFRPVNRAGSVTADRLGEKVVWQLIKPYAEAAGVPGIAPHDLRRTCAKLCRAGGGELEQIQLLLGHASVQTTEGYLGTKQDLVHAPNDAIKLRVAL